MNGDRQFLVACYLEDGSHHGWHTVRGTLSFLSSSALRFSSKQAADNRIVRLEATWPTAYMWCAEREPKYDIDVRTGQRLDGAGGARLDTINRQPLESSLPQTDGLPVQQGESMPVKKKIVKPATKVSPVPKMKLRTTSAKGKTAASKAATAAASNGASRTSRLPCLCNCGELSTNYLLRGHWKKIKGYLNEIKAGSAKPEKLFGAKIAKAMGPWVANRGGGMKPATTDYAKIRANLNA